MHFRFFATDARPFTWRFRRIWQYPCNVTDLGLPSDTSFSLSRHDFGNTPRPALAWVGWPFQPAIRPRVGEGAGPASARRRF